MATLQVYKDSGWQQKIKYLLIAGVVLFIVLLCPNNTHFKYMDFIVGQTWKHETLFAPFDFSLWKDEQTLSEDRLRLENAFPPHYYFREQSAQKLKLLDSLYAIGNLEASATERNLLLYLYSKRGIVLLDNAHLKKDKASIFKIIRGNAIYTMTRQQLLEWGRMESWLNDSLANFKHQANDTLHTAFFKQVLTPNVYFSDTLTQQLKQQALASISNTTGKIKKGETIVAKGDNITPDIQVKLLSLKKEYESLGQQSEYYWLYMGYFIIVSLIVLVFMLVIKHHATSIFDNLPQLIFILMWLSVFALISYLVRNAQEVSPYIIPFCIVPITIKNFFSKQAALFTHIVVILLSGIVANWGYEFTTTQLVVGMVASYNNVQTKDWTKFFTSISLIFLTYLGCFLGFKILQIGVGNTDWYTINWIVINAFISLTAYPLIALLERIFGFTSAIQLSELSDLDRPLLKELAAKAPGTFQHSLQVANLAEAAANEIQANALLVKVAAYYHDIGKMAHPSFFIENQTGNNPHDELPETESARLIIEHVEEGVKLANKHRLPTVLIDFIRSHHGNTRVEYFYKNFIQDHPNSSIDEDVFRYSGPLPATKEQTILMIADSLEASSRILQSPSEQEIFHLVDRIVDRKINDGQLEHSTLTFHELEQCKKMFKTTLRSIYHTRINYPDAEEVLE